jgi:hypothetical protein
MPTKMSVFELTLVIPTISLLKRPVQPTAKFEFVRTPGVKVVVEFTGYMFSGFSGAGAELHGGPEVFQFGLDSFGKPCFVSADGRPAYPADISRQVGALGKVLRPISLAPKVKFTI